MEPSRSWKPRAKLWVNIFLDVWLHKNTKNTHKYKNNYKHKYEDEISKVSGLGGGHHPPSTSCPTPARSVSTSRSRSASSTRPLSLSSLPSTSSLSKHRKGQLGPWWMTKKCVTFLFIPTLPPFPRSVGIINQAQLRKRKARHWEHSQNCILAQRSYLGFGLSVQINLCAGRLP